MVLRNTLIALLFVALSAPALAKSKWTLMVYQASDNNLETPQLHDLQEMIDAGGDSNVNVIVFCDRYEGFSEDGVANIKNWTSAKVFKVLKGKLVELADWGETDTTDEKTLKRFIAFAAKNFPAEKYGLVLEDHGGGWTGGFSDDTSTDEIGELTVNEIRGAIESNSKQTGRLQFVGFDACLMSNIETAYALSPVAKFLYASEEVEPGAGWHYTPWINALKADPRMSLYRLGQHIVDSYFDSYDKSEDPDMVSDSPMLTLAVTDLSKIQAVVDAVHAVGTSAAQELGAKRETWVQYASVRSITEAYAVEAGDLAIYDAATLFKNLQNRDITTSTKQHCARAEAAVRAAVLYARKGRARPDSRGLSICVPSDPEVLNKEEGNTYTALTFNKSPQWKTFLNALSQETVEDVTPPFVGTIALSDTTVTGDGTVEVTAEMREASDLEQSWLFLARKNDADDNMLVLGKMPAPFGESDKMAVGWDGKWFQMTDGDNFYVCPTMHNVQTSGGLLFYVYGQVRAKGGADWVTCTLVFFLDRNSKGDADFVYAIQKSKYGISEVPFKLGDEVRPLYAEVLTDGDARLVFMEQAPALSRTTGLRVSYGDVPGGEYLIGFIAEDFAGNVSQSFTSCTIKRK